MDENKEFEINSNKSNETVADKEQGSYDFSLFEEPDKEDVETELADNTDDVASENTDNVEDSSEMVIDKKKPLLQFPICVAGVLVILLALSLFAAKGFFDTSVYGTWSIVEEDTDTATADEAEENNVIKTYYTFLNDGETADTGTVKIQIGSMTYIGTYSVTQSAEKNKENTISLSVPMAGLTAEYGYSVSGNMFTGRTLNLSDATYGYNYEFKSDKFKKPSLKVEDDFTVNSDIIGKWNYDDGFYNFTYEFNEDGTVHIDQFGMFLVDGVYSCSDATITITYCAVEETTMDIEFSFNNGNLLLNGIPYTLVTDSTPDEA
ncbi:MAG: DUF5640 domain-containing protein [Ruminococcus sp.]|nr:DUF5640 domain-containing protein [Ruminococcus sp.]